MKIEKIFIFLNIALFQAYALSQIKVICDKNNESIYIDGKFKTECDKNEPVRILVKAGKHTVVVKKNDKEGRYDYVKSFHIGDKVAKVIEVKTKPVYNEYHYYAQAKNSESISDCDEYLQRYPNGKYKNEIKELKDYILAKGDFEKYLAYVKKYPNGKYREKLKNHFMKRPIITVLYGQPSSVTQITLTRDDKKLFSVGFGDTNLIEWDLDSYKIIKKMSYNPKGSGSFALGSIALSLNEKEALTGGLGLRKWNLTTGESERISSLYYTPDNIAYLDNKKAITSGKGTIRIWDLESRKYRQIYPKNGDYSTSINHFTLSKDKRYLFFGEYNDKRKRYEIVEFDLKRDSIVKRFANPLFRDEALSLAVTDDMRYLITGTDDGENSISHGKHDDTILIWDISTGNLIKRLRQKGSVYAIALDIKNRRFASGGKSGEIKLWDIDTWKLIGSFPTYSYVNDLRFTHKGDKLLAALGNKEIQVFYTGFFNKDYVNKFLFNECINGKTSSCNNFLKEADFSKSQRAKEEILKKIALVVGKPKKELFSDPKIYVLDRLSREAFETKNAKYDYLLEALVSQGEKTYALIDMYHKNANFTFNSPIYLIQKDKRVPYSKRYPSDEKIGIPKHQNGVLDKEVVLVFENFPLQRGKVAIIENPDKNCKGCLRLDQSEIIKIR